MGSMTGRVTVITGGNGGIGLGLGTGIAKAGGDIMIWGRNPEKNASAVEDLSSLGVRAEALVCDVSDEEQVIEAVARTVESMGQVDALIANAGRGGYGTPFLELGLDEWRTVMSVNLDGLFLCLREGAKQMVAQGTGGSLVGVSSTSAIHGAAGNEAYGASKTAVLGLVRALAVGMARHQIRVNALVPGWVTTEMTAGAKDRPKFMEATTKRTPVRRWGEPADFEEVGAFLADPSISYHTGQEVVVDGGYTVF